MCNCRALQPKGGHPEDKAGTAAAVTADSEPTPPVVAIQQPDTQNRALQLAAQAPPRSLTTVSTRRSTRSSSPAVKLAGNDLVGLACSIW